MKLQYDPEAIAQQARQAVEPYRDQVPAVVATIEDCEAAAAVLAQIKAQAKALDTRRRDITKPLDDAKKAIMDLFREPLEALAGFEAHIKGLIGAFHQAQEKKRIGQERMQRELAQKEQDRLAKLATKAADRGDTAKAIEFGQKAELAGQFQPVAVLPGVAQVKGVTTKKVWKFRIVDEAQVPREYLLVNEKMVGEVARATKGALRIPGIEFYAEDTVVATGSRQ